MNQSIARIAVISTCVFVTALSMLSITLNVKSINQVRTQPTQAVVDAAYQERKAAEIALLRAQADIDPRHACVARAMIEYRATDGKNRPDAIQFLNAYCGPVTRQ